QGRPLPAPGRRLRPRPRSDHRSARPPHGLLLRGRARRHPGRRAPGRQPRCRRRRGRGPAGGTGPQPRQAGRRL
ncbi:uncharacterized protein METZ01_LOCUS202026, partial [marine metagenome]